MERFALVAAILLLHPLVGQVQRDAGIQERQLPQAGSQDVIFVFRHGKDASVRLERDSRTGCVGLSDHLHIVQGLSTRKLLHIDMTIPTYNRLQIG